MTIVEKQDNLNKIIIWDLLIYIMIIKIIEKIKTHLVDFKPILDIS